MKIMSAASARERRNVALAILLALISIALEAGSLNLFGRLVDHVLKPAKFAEFPVLAALYAGLSLALVAADYGAHVMLAHASTSYSRRMRTGIFGRLLHLPASFYDRRTPGDLLTRLDSDVDTVESVSISGIAGAIASALRVVIFAGIMIYLNPVLALVAAVVAPFTVLTSKFMGARLTEIEETSRLAASDVMGASEAGLYAEADIRAFGWQTLYVEKLDAASARAQQAALRATRASAGLDGINHLVQLAAALAVIGVGVWQLAAGVTSLGSLLVFLGFLLELSGPIGDLSGWYTHFKAAEISRQRLVEIVEEGVPAGEDVVLNRPILEFSDVSFGYESRESVLNGVSFAVRPGELVALVGASGSGKSTLAKLAHRAYEPDGGDVFLGGHAVSDLSPQTISHHVAVVSQHSAMLDGTIRENVALACLCASPEDVDAAMRRAGVLDFAMSLPDGVNTFIGGHGRELSGGQRQRIALARALVRNSAVLIVDEPTTGLDDVSRQQVIEALRAAARDAAVLVITHEDDVSAAADRRLVLEDGVVREARALAVA